MQMPREEPDRGFIKPQLVWPNADRFNSIQSVEIADIDTVKQFAGHEKPIFIRRHEEIVAVSCIRIVLIIEETMPTLIDIGDAFVRKTADAMSCVANDGLIITAPDLFLFDSDVAVFTLFCEGYGFGNRRVRLIVVFSISHGKDRQISVRQPATRTPVAKCEERNCSRVAGSAVWSFLLTLLYSLAISDSTVDALFRSWVAIRFFVSIGSISSM